MWCECVVLSSDTTTCILRVQAQKKNLSRGSRMQANFSPVNCELQAASFIHDKDRLLKGHMYEKKMGNKFLQFL